MHIKNLIANTVFLGLNICSILLQTREKKIAKILIKESIKVATAESCTGGLVSSRLTDISGSSSYIFQNLVTYANEAKEELLGVKKETIEKYGVVSEEVALEMVNGLLNKYNCDVAISTTGIAGPTGGSDRKPVGLICIGIGSKDMQKTYSYKANPFLYRRIMKYAFSNKALDLFLDFLNSRNKHN